MDDQSRFLDFAHQIGRRLADQAVWDGDVCTWNIMKPDFTSEHETHLVPGTAPATLYRGTAGIGLFLGELYCYTQDQDVKATAEGAIRYALSRVDQLPVNSFGFYTGRIGVAYAATRIGRCFNKPKYVERVTRILEPIEGKEDQDQTLDVIGGAAGSIPALLQLTAWLDTELPARLALNLGDSLIEKAFHEPVGWSWAAINSTVIRHLTGYGHGMSGIGHAFLELYSVTGAERYRYAAEQAFLYERQFLDEEQSNWPDFRCSEWSKYRRKGPDELKTALRNDEVPPPKKTYMSAWCHGAPGIGLARLRAYALFDHETHFEEAKAALEETQNALDPSWNYSLCHGIGGNCETLLYAASVLNNPALREQAQTCGEWGRHYAVNDAASWPCGTTDAASDPTLMLGEAGIGYFYLRLFSEETPSCLFLRAPDSLDISISKPSGHLALQRDYVATYFEETLRILDALDVDSPPNPECPVERSLYRSDVKSFYKRLTTWLSSLKEPSRSILEDATRLDRVRYEMQEEIDDFTKELITTVRRPAIENISWEIASFELGPHSRIVERRWAWGEWLSSPPSERSSIPEKKRLAYLFYRSNNQIQDREIAPFAELVLRSLETPAPLSQVVHVVKKNADLDGVPQKVLRQKIIEQLSQAYEAGVIRHVQTTEVT